ncbi:hypothetical protein C8F04DRAFT_1403374 [Mycena alexandri]|uniref:Uncharacterized protein n=1 Tax=Mycena alexandri TaxID=1745969 RepID=A0AAD6S4N7_9AGAR|nr:hypothetical protein C8F04DRAFT_1403374 [Mycena alexandri]
MYLFALHPIPPSPRPRPALVYTVCIPPSSHIPLIVPPSRTPPHTAARTRSNAATIEWSAVYALSALVYLRAWPPCPRACTCRARLRRYPRAETVIVSEGKQKFRAGRVCADFLRGHALCFIPSHHSCSRVECTRHLLLSATTRGGGWGRALGPLHPSLPPPRSSFPFHSSICTFGRGCHGRVREPSASSPRAGAKCGTGFLDVRASRSCAQAGRVCADGHAPCPIPSHSLLSLSPPHALPFPSPIPYPPHVLLYAMFE